MAHVVTNRVGENSTSTGTGSFTLTGALTSYAKFSDRLSLNDTCWYQIDAYDATTGQLTGAYEYGLGSYSAANTLTRTSPINGSGGANNLVNFGAGPKKVTMSILAPDSITAPQWRQILGLGTGSAGSAGSVSYIPTAGRQQDLQTRISSAKKSVLEFGVMGIGMSVDNKVRTRYQTLALARIDYPNVPNLSLDDQLDLVGLYEAWLWMNKNGRPIDLEGLSFNLNRPIISSGYINVEGSNCNWGGKNMVKGRIDDGMTVAPDLTYPTSSNPACMDGCFIYVADPAYYIKFANINMYDARFGICYFNDPNSPIHRNLTFNYMNAGVFYYLGCQNARYYNCGGAPLGVLHISSSTAFPSDHPARGNDNFYSDNCTFANEWGFNSFGIYVYNAFDIWFRESILRPTVQSTVANGETSVYSDGSNGKGNPYDPNDEKCLCTGRLIYMAFRGVRICFSLIMKGQDSRGPGMKRGYAYIGTEVKTLTIEGNQYEQLFEGLPDNDTRPALFTVGSITTGTIREQAQITYIDKAHPFIAYTGRGQNEGFTDDRGIENLNAQPNLIKDRVGIRGYRQGKHYLGEIVFPTVFNVFRDQYRQDPNAPLDAFYPVHGTTISNFEVSILKESVPFMVQLPWTASDGRVRVQSLLRTYDPFCGYLEIMVRNCTTGEIDCARYYVATGSSEQRTLAAAVNNGNTTITFTSEPNEGGRTQRYGEWSTTLDGTGKGFTTDLYLGGNQLRVLNRVSGLGGQLNSGTVMYRNRACYPVQDFQRGWITLVNVDSPGGGIDFQGDDVIAIKNNMGDYNNPNGTDALEITIRTSHLASPGDRRYATAAPTSGYHMQGEEVLRLREAGTPVRRWVCRTTGNATSSNGLFFAADYDTLSGATGSRPNLTANDSGVLYFDTTLNKLVRWSGSGWQG